MKLTEVTHKISIKLLLVIMLIIILVSSSLGTLAYQFAKNELINSGKLDLKHLVDTSIPVLELLNKKVEKGEITLEEAKEQAREIIVGPKSTTNDGKIIHDYSQSKFLYKKNGYIFIYNSKGHVEVHPIIQVGEDKSNLKDSQGVYVIQTIIKVAQAKQIEDHYFTYLWKNPGEEKEREKITYVAYYKPWDWNIGIGAYTDEFYASLQDLKKWIILITLVSIVLSALTFYVLARSKFKVLNNVTQSARKLASGQLEIEQLPESKDEFGILASTFNLLAKDIRHVMNKLKDQGKTLVLSSANLSAISEETKASAEEISSALNRIKDGTAQQVYDIETTANKIHTLSTSVEKMNEQNRYIKEITDTSNRATMNGKEMITTLQHSKVANDEATTKINVSIKNIFEGIQDIANITKMIEAISEKTNILALNASIEAARAGEHGSGFSIVATEVRKHAEESNAASRQIQDMVLKLVQETEATVTYMEETMHLSDELSKSVNQTEKEFTHIEKAVIETKEAGLKLTEEIQSVTAQNKEIVLIIQGLAAGLKQTAASSEEITSSMQEQLRADTEVTAAAESLNELSEAINHITQKYTY